MVNIVRAADAVVEADKVAYAGYHIVGQNMPWYQVVHMLLKVSLKRLLIKALAFLKELHERRIMHLLVESGLLRVEGKIAACVNKHVAKHLQPFIINGYEYAPDAAVLYLNGGLAVYLASGFSKYLAAVLVYNVIGAYLAGYARGKAQLFIELIAAHPCKVIPPVKEQRVEQAPRALLSRRLARTLALVYFYKPVLNAFCGILIKRVDEPFLLAHQLYYLGVGTVSQGAQQSRHIHLALTVYLNVHDLA